MHSPGASRLGLLGAAGEIRVGALETGARWEYSLDEGKTWTAGQGAVLTPGMLGADGGKQLMASQIDAAGSRSLPAELAFVMDTVVMPPVIALANDTGTADDRITRNAEIAVTGIEPDSVWTYRIDDGPWKSGSGNLIAASEFGADGDHAVEVRQNDAAGNVSSASLAFKLVHAVAAPTLSLAQDTGASAADRITSVATVKVGGLANGGAWEYSLNGIDWADGVGDSIHASVFGRDGPQRVYVRHTDGGGNPSPSAQLDFTLDTQAAKPDCVLRSAARDNYPIANTKAGSSLFHTGNDVNRDSWIQVKQEAGAMAWRYSLDGGASYQTGSGDRISLGSVKPGAMEVWVQQQDVAGNWSSERAVTLNVDLQAPTVSAQYFWRTTDGRLSQRTAFTADEDVQVLFIPVDTANDGTPSSYLSGWLKSGLLVKAGPAQTAAKQDWLQHTVGLHVAVAVDRAGNAAFVSMHGQDSEPGHEDLHVVMIADGQLMNTRVVDAKLEGSHSIARASTSSSDHLYGTAAADVFYWWRNGADREGDWIHGYNRREGDLIEFGYFRFDTTSPGEISKYLRKDVKADGTISLWVDFDGNGETSALNYDQRILITPGDASTDLQIRLSRSGSEFVL